MTTTDLPESPMAMLMAQKKEVEAKLYKDLRVPRWPAALYVRYRIVTPAEVDKYVGKKMRATQPDPDALSIGSAELLVEACIGIFIKVDGKEVSPIPGFENGELPRFGEADFAKTLGVPEPYTARRICEAMFFSEFDLIGHADAICDWSGVSRQETDEEFSGN